MTIFRLGSLVAAALVTAATAVSSETLVEAWRLTSLYRFAEARAVFAAHEGREARLGEATALLNVQPRTQENIDRAARLLEQVAAAAPRDTLGLNARYLRARIEDVHRQRPDGKLAVRLYRELRRDTPPGHPLAEQASIDLILLELFGPVGEGAPLERLHRAEALGVGLTSHAACRDFHLLLARGWLYFDQDRSRALAHYEAAWAAGILNFTTRADVLLAIGELAREVGPADRAREVYARFLAEFPRDDRANDVRDRLDALKVQPEAPE